MKDLRMMLTGREVSKAENKKGLSQAKAITLGNGSTTARERLENGSTMFRQCFDYCLGLSRLRLNNGSTLARLWKYAAMLLMVLTLGVGEMWGDAIYYYRGNQNSWGESVMTVSSDGFYEYFSAKGYSSNGNKNNNFKVSLGGDTWTYNNAYCTRGFNGTNISGTSGNGSIGLDWDGDNICVYNTDNFYILVYYPNTCINTTANPIICASTTLPDGPIYLVGDTWIGSWDATASGNKMTRSASSWTKTISSVTKADHKMKVTTYNFVNSYGGAAFENTSTANIYSSSTDGDGNLVFQPAIAGDVTITFIPSTEKINLTCAAPTITFDDEGGDGGDGTMNTYYGEAPTSVSVPEKDGYSFAGYWTGDDGTGTQVIGANGAWLRNVSNYTNNDATWKWIVRANSTLHAKWTQDPTITLNSVTPSSSIVAGNDITLVGTRGNSSNTISFQYTTNNGSTWTDITPKTSSLSSNTLTVTWTVPDAHGATQTFKFRAKLAEATPIYTDKSDGVTVYNTKTLHVKNSNNWGTLYLYAWDSESAKLNDNWPGKTGVGFNGLSCTQRGSGLWWDVVITSQVSGFILNRDTKGDSNQTVDLSYGNYSNDACYAIGTSSGKRTLSNTTVSCLSAPSVTTASVTATVNNSATLGGNITGLGNDKVSYGYYYGTNSALSSSNTGVGTQVQVGTGKMSTGSYSNSQTGLTGGTTYYVMAYATNGYSTAYGSVESFTTPKKVTPSLSTGGQSISPSTVQYTSTYIDFTAVKKDGYTFSAWTKTNGNLSNAAQDGSTNTVRFTPTSDNATITATYTEDMHTVTVTTDGHGTITTPASGTPRTVSVGIATGKTIAASASTGYTFYNWTKTSGSGTVTFTNANANSTTVKSTSDATVRANFVDMWNVKGSWDSWAAYEPMTATGVSNTYSATKTLAAKTEYHIKVVKRVDNNSSNDKWYGVNGGTTLSRATGSVTGLEENGGETEYITFTTDAAGDYTITYLYNASVGSMKITITYPTAYTITYGGGTINGSSTAISVSPSFTSGDYVLPETDVTFSKGSTKAGYTWKGWYGNVGGTGDAWSTTDASLSLTATRTGNISVYACYNYATYTATLSTIGRTGYGSGAPANQTATYTQAMPTITPPTATNGYCFMGYWDGEEGTGTQYYNANGTSAHAWDKTSGATLYAYFKKAEFTTLEHNATVAKGDVITLDVNPVLNVTPVGYTAICWTLHYAENDNEVATSGASYYAVAAYTEGGTKPRQVRFTLNNMSVGSYYVKAVLKASASSGFDPCSTGTTLDTETGSFSVVGSSKVTIQYKDLSSGNVIASSSSVEIEAGGNADVEAPSIIGYTFNSWSVGAGVTKNSEDGNTINISSPYDGVITAFYTKKRVIYFNNTLGWDTVCVYFYKNDSYWGVDSNEGKGTGANTGYTFDNTPYGEGKHGGMQRVAPGSNIWYFDAEGAGVNASYTNVVFADKEQHGYNWFYEANVVRRSDYKSTTLPMYVPLAGDPTPMNNDKTNYYFEGYWMNYPDNTGYTLYIFNTNAANGVSHTEIKHIPFSFTADKAMPMSVTTDLEAGHTYGFKIKRADESWYGNTGTMSNGHSGDGAQTAWEFKSQDVVPNDCGLTTSGAGNYTFTLNYGLDASSNYNYLVGVRYPESTGDFRVQYKDNVNSTWKTSVVIPAVTEADTISYFVRKASTPYIRVQKCTATYGGGKTTVTWNNENSGSNIISSLPTAITENGVYNFIFKKVDGALVLDKVEPYTGNFYIRVDGAGSTNWDNYRAADHLMPFSEYSFNQTTDPYSHYYTQWYAAESESKNIKFVVANDYSTNISDTITRDGIADSYVDALGALSGRNANIRFMYNYKTNVATRRYIDGAQEDDSEFLLLIPSNNTSIYDAATEGNAYTQVKFSDNGNWVYEANVYVVPGTTYKLKSQFGVEPNIITQYFKGAASGAGEYETLIGGSGARLQIRLIYDFKTNRLVTGYVPSGTIDTNIELNADIMFVREHQGNVTQITFGEDKSITEIKNVYTTLKFNKSTITNPGLSRYERDLYYISFPYDVLVSDIIGFGTYGTHWIIEYYDGAGRAEKGFWADSKSFWKFVTPAMKSTYKLKAGTGYIVALDLDEMESTDPVWEHTETVELIFPGNISSISDQEVTYNMPSHQCNIGPRFEGGDDRRIKDSHWNVLGVPAYHNTTGSFANHTDEIGETSQVWSASNAPNYLYTWNMTDNSLSVTNASGYEYKAMHAYMVQYYGDVTFHTSTNAAPASVAARTYAEAPSEVQFRLEIQQNEVAVDQTFVTMSNDGEVSREFVFGEDMSKEFNKNKANIYTIVTSTIEGDATVTEVAGNTLPMSEQTTLVPVGVKVVENADYTFSIPDGTEGVGVTLIDKVADTYTNLSGLDYTVSLEAGTYDDRFVLQISPIQHVVTDVEGVESQKSKVESRKVLIDGLLYIVRDGKMYDARGARVE